MPTVFFGSDTECLTDIGLFDKQVTSPPLLIGQRVARRLFTPRGGLASVNDDPNFGWDVRQYVNAKLSPTELAQAQAQVSAECCKDEEVQSAQVTFSLVPATGALTIAVALVSSAGPFSLVMNVGQLTTTMVFTFA